MNISDSVNFDSGSEQIDYFYSIRPCIGERVSGDTAVIIEQKNRLLAIAIIDALGHGYNAHLVARSAENYLQENWDGDVCDTMLCLHKHLKGSLGAAVGLAILDSKTNQLSYTGIGNTVIRILRQQDKKDSSQKLYSVEGIVGENIPHPTEQTIQLKQSDLVLFYTDGIKERISPEEYPTIFSDDVMTIAKKMVRLFGKNYDDATCIALRIKGDLDD